MGQQEADTGRFWVEGRPRLHSDSQCSLIRPCLEKKKKEKKKRGERGALVVLSCNWAPVSCWWVFSLQTVLWQFMCQWTPGLHTFVHLGVHICLQDKLSELELLSGVFSSAHHLLLLSRAQRWQRTVSPMPPTSLDHFSASSFSIPMTSDAHNTLRSFLVTLPL